MFTNRSFLIKEVYHLLKVKKENEFIHIKGSRFMYVWMFLATVGFLIVCSALIINGLKFDSKYSLFYLAGGLVFTPFYLYLTLWSLPGLIPGKTLLRIVQGENGSIVSKKGTVSITNIRNIDLVRNPLNLINDIVIETFENKKVKIRTFNILDELDYQVMVDQYIYPYMTENTKKVWDRKVNLDLLLKEVRYERQEQKIN
ncbi:hypothetical protein FS935_21210 [Metabacillus litoralis]|uniref:YfjD family protein n=1 Tax=Metabacillus litoralis TaxID=152268 RepID=A0A5C6VAA6_9BACI|nr:hypothetical protein FS935_21210 [Metabacillus litoralis]